MPLFSIIIAELLFTIASYFYYRRSGFLVKNVASQVSTHNERVAPDKIALLLQICADILFLSLLLYFSGGATNAFVSLLLIPIAIAAVTLTPVFLALVAGLAIAAYSVLLWLMPMSVMHGNMEGHFIGMWINFVISAIVIAFVIGTLNSTLRAREATISRTREQQLRHEQLLTLDGAAAQVTHQLATPIANLQLLFEELKEQQADDPIVHEMAKPLAQCKEQLAHFRSLSNALRTGETQQVISAKALQNTIQDAMTLHFPEQSLQWLNDAPDCSILSDAMLLPAILNLLQNAVSANNHNQQHNIEAKWQIDEQILSLSLRDFGQGFSEQQMASLGGQLMPSSDGMGMAVMLSNVTLERLNGSLTLSNHPHQGAIAMVSLKIV